MLRLKHGISHIRDRACRRSAAAMRLFLPAIPLIRWARLIETAHWSLVDLISSRNNAPCWLANVDVESGMPECLTKVALALYVRQETFVWHSANIISQTSFVHFYYVFFCEMGFSGCQYPCHYPLGRPSTVSPFGTATGPSHLWNLQYSAHLAASNASKDLFLRECTALLDCYSSHTDEAMCDLIGFPSWQFALLSNSGDDSLLGGVSWPLGESSSSLYHRGIMSCLSSCIVFLYFRATVCFQFFFLFS